MGLVVKLDLKKAYENYEFISLRVGSAGEGFPH